MKAHVIAVVNLKGGSAKTTTSVFLAHSLGATRRVMLVDADPQGSALRWSGLADWPFPALGLSIGDLHRRLPGVIGDDYDVVVIDTPPLEERANIVHSALRAAHVVVVPMAPTMMELDRVGPVRTAVEDVASLRDGSPPVRVLLNRTVANATSTDTVRQVLTEQGWHVLAATVPRLERYAQAFGASVPTDDEPYRAVADELADVAVMEASR